MIKGPGRTGKAVAAAPRAEVIPTADAWEKADLARFLHTRGTGVTIADLV